jgi:hypothetical protein
MGGGINRPNSRPCYRLSLVISLCTRLCEVETVAENMKYYKV